MKSMCIGNTQVINGINHSVSHKEQFHELLKDCSEITHSHWKNFHPSKENQVELLIKHLGLEELDTIKEEVESVNSSDEGEENPDIRLSAKSRKIADDLGLTQNRKSVARLSNFNSASKKSIPSINIEM